MGAQQYLVALSAVIFCSSLLVGAEAEPKQVDREGKILPVFNIIKFTNDFCTSTSGSRNGTCYTTSECSDLGGTAGDDCAEGFGVCCYFELSCGGSSSQNATYIINTSPTTDCSYTICPSSTNICRIRFDFESFSMASQQIGTAAATGGTNVGSVVGGCKTDQFSIDGPKAGSPVICGTNTGQHMILDSDGSTCHTVNALIDTDTTATRSWTIHVSQYTCQNEYSGGPPGCLQYHYNSNLATSVSGAISNFGWDRSVTTVGVTTTHLTNQNYNICIRRPEGCHGICYDPAIQASITDTSFGLSVGPTAAIAQSSVGTSCSTDHLMIPGGTAIANLNESPAIAATDPDANKVCGRFMNVAGSIAGTVSVCTRITPFVIGVYTDNNEANTGTDSTTNELDLIPGGIVGFHLNYALQC